MSPSPLPCPRASRRAAGTAPLLLLCAAFGAFTAFTAFAADPQIAVSLEKSGEVFVVDATLDLQVPLRTAWDVLTDFDAMAGILSNLTSSKVVRRNGNTLFVEQAGRAKYGIFSYTFASEREVRLEPMRRIVVRQLSGTAQRFDSETGLATGGQGTRVHYHAEIVPGSGIARTFGGPFIAHEIEEQLGALATEMLRRKLL